MAVVVEIDNARSPADVARLDADAGADGDVVEVALAVVPVEDVRVVGEMRLEDVEVAVEVVVADADAHARLLHAIFAQRHAALERLLRGTCRRADCGTASSGVESQAT